jgi:hypothetical protein
MVTQSHGGSRNAIADGGEASIAPQAGTQGGVANETKADRSDDWPQHATCRGLDHAQTHDHREHRPDGKGRALRQIAETASPAPSPFNSILERGRKVFAYQRLFFASSALFFFEGDAITL